MEVTLQDLLNAQQVMSKTFRGDFRARTAWNIQKRSTATNAEFDAYNKVQAEWAEKHPEWKPVPEEGKELTH